MRHINASAGCLVCLYLATRISAETNVDSLQFQAEEFAKKCFVSHRENIVFVCPKCKTRQVSSSYHGWKENDYLKRIGYYRFVLICLNCGQINYEIEDTGFTDSELIEAVREKLQV